MSSLVHSVLAQLERLPLWRRGWCWLCEKHQRLELKYATRPGPMGWFWRLTHNPEWQRSSLLSATVFLLNSVAIWRLVAAAGHGWMWNLAASLVTDVVMYWGNKRWAFKSHNAPVLTSATWSALWWITFLGFNTGIAYLLMSQADVGTLWARCALGTIGVLLNPWVFEFRDRVAFRRGNSVAAVA